MITINNKDPNTWICGCGQVNLAREHKTCVTCNEHKTTSRATESPFKFNTARFFSISDFWKLKDEIQASRAAIKEARSERRKINQLQVEQRRKSRDFFRRYYPAKYQ